MKILVPFEVYMALLTTEMLFMALVRKANLQYTIQRYSNCHILFWVTLTGLVFLSDSREAAQREIQLLFHGTDINCLEKGHSLAESDIFPLCFPRGSTFIAGEQPN